MKLFLLFVILLIVPFSCSQSKRAIFEKKLVIPKLDTSRFLPLEDQVEFLKKLDRSSEDVNLEVIGNTFIKHKSVINDIHLVTVGSDVDPILFFDCNIHAREWISSAVCHYLIWKLAHEFHKTGKQASSVRSFQWHFMPMANPDGYQYSHLDDQEKHRLWRKNRRPARSMEFDSKEQMLDCLKHPEGEGFINATEGECDGVDLNRNFPSGWGDGSEHFQEYSKYVSDEIYKGHKALSEPETRALHKHITENRDRILTAISVHCYGNVFLLPKGYLPTNHPDQLTPPDKARLEKMLKFINKDLGYSISNVADFFGETELSGGATDDYYYTFHDIKYTFTMELDPKNKTEHKLTSAFLLPAKQIRPVGRKIWRAMKRMAFYLEKNKEEEGKGKGKGKRKITPRRRRKKKEIRN